MTDRMNQVISRFLDEDLERNEAVGLLKQMQDDSELRSTLQRYLTAQQAMRNESRVMASGDFLSRVSNALENEPVVLLPRHQAPKYSKHTRVYAVAATIAALSVIASVVFKPSVMPLAGQMTLAQNERMANERVRTYPVNQRFEEYLLAHNGSLYTNGAASVEARTQLATYGR